MYLVEVNVDPKLIGHGELCVLIAKAIEDRILKQARENEDESLVRVKYQDPEKLSWATGDTFVVPQITINQNL